MKFKLGHEDARGRLAWRTTGPNFESVWQPFKHHAEAYSQEQAVGILAQMEDLEVGHRLIVERVE